MHGAPVGHRLVLRSLDPMLDIEQRLLDIGTYQCATAVPQLRRSDEHDLVLLVIRAHALHDAAVLLWRQPLALHGYALKGLHSIGRVRPPPVSNAPRKDGRSDIYIRTPALADLVVPHHRARERERLARAKELPERLVHVDRERPRSGIAWVCPRAFEFSFMIEIRSSRSAVF